jgi:signal transduction histidine kinase/ActR/RegA family two-component response regulator
MMMTPAGRMGLLAALMAAVCLIASGIALVVLYNEAIDHNADRLVGTVRSATSLIEAMAEHEQAYAHITQGIAEHGVPLAATLDQIRVANERLGGLGLTGEFTLARREGDRIVFLLEQRFSGNGDTTVLPWSAATAEPMRLALSGKSGTLIGRDYRGVRVLAAHHFIETLNLGIVTKIDLTEVQAPYKRAAGIVLVVTLVLVGLAAGVFYRVSSPMIAALQAHTVSLEAEVEARKRSETELAINEARLRALYDLTQAEFADENAVIIFALNQAVRLTGSEIGYFCFIKDDRIRLGQFTWSDRVGEVCSAPTDLHYPLNDAGVWAECARTGQPVLHNDFANQPGRKGQPDGHPELIRHLSVPVFHQGKVALIAGVGNKVEPYDEADVRQIQLFFGEVWKTICHRRAVAENKTLEKQLEQAQKMESVGRLAGGVAHDFNNLLTAILGYCDLMLDEMPAGDAMRHDAEDAKRAAERAAALTDQLLAFSRRQMIRPRTMNLNEVISGSARMVERIIGEDVDFKFIPGQDLWTAHLDPHQLEQVLVNLAVNARDAMPDGGLITVETKNTMIDSEYARINPEAREGEFVVLSVSDLGQGIDEKTLETIFEPFFTTKPQGQGTGLGLSTVYGIVKQNHGFVNVYTEVGMGTTFRVFFPRSIPDDQAAKTVELPVTIESRGETVLVVEDETVLRELIARYLGNLGYKLLLADGGDEAVELAQANEQIDLLVTDVIMPGINGKKVYEAVGRIHPDIHVLFMSGYTENVIARHGVLDSDVDFLQKPFTMEQFGRTIRAVLERGKE